MSMGGTALERSVPGVVRILHVDDQPDFADMAATFLERIDERFEVETATGADEGLELLGENEYDCVVSDYEMPRLNGIEFLEAVRVEYPDLPFILFTGKGSEEVAADAISSGATDYLQKKSGIDQYDLLANRITNAVAKAQSQQAERHLGELAENTDRILYIFSQEWGELLFINAAYEEIWGRSIDALRADPNDFLNGIHPDDRVLAREAMDQITTGETIEIEVRVNAEEDFQRWVRIRGEPIVDESGDVVRVAGFATDVTERKELQQKLRERTDRLTEAQRVAGVGSWEWRVGSDTIEWSDETYRIFGREPGDPEQPAFQDWLDAIHPEDREEVRGSLDKALETGSFPTFEHRLETADGDVRWVKCRGEVTESDGDFVRINGTVLDITERVETERSVEYQRSVLESVVETLPLGVLVVDEAREFFTFNGRFVEMWDIPETVVERGDDREALDAVLASLERPEEFLESVEYYYDHPEESGRDRIHLEDGRVFERFTAPATGDDGTYYGRIWVFRDVTAHVEADR